MSSVIQIHKELQCIDLNFQGQPGVIASYLLEDSGERALIETGPSTTLDTLLASLREAGIEPESISQVLVTHIHLDHAGAAGTFIRRYPNAHLFVHEVGAPHLIDPSKLLSSAERIYGDQMEALWGKVEAVPAERLTALRDCDVVRIGNKEITALYTPGHASHHLAYHDPEHNVVFTGDVAGVRLQGVQQLRPPTPPPDIDLHLWSQSVERLASMNLRSLYLTHFGSFTDLDWHLHEVLTGLYDLADFVERAVEEGRDRTDIIDSLKQATDDALMQQTDDESLIQRYELAIPYGMTVDGLLRYLKKRGQASVAVSS